MPDLRFKHLEIRVPYPKCNGAGRHRWQDRRDTSVMCECRCKECDGKGWLPDNIVVVDEAPPNVAEPITSLLKACKGFERYMETERERIRLANAAEAQRAVDELERNKP